VELDASFMASSGLLGIECMYQSHPLLCSRFVIFLSQSDNSDASTSFLFEARRQSTSGILFIYIHAGKCRQGYASIAIESTKPITCLCSRCSYAIPYRFDEKIV
jgi:hypothetical protein